MKNQILHPRPLYRFTAAIKSTLRTENRSILTLETSPREKKQPLNKDGYQLRELCVQMLDVAIRSYVSHPVFLVRLTDVIQSALRTQNPSY